MIKLSDLIDLSHDAPAGEEILQKCLEIAELLLEKNIAYGNSALEPIRIFSKASTSEQLLTRIDDKLNRLKNGTEYKSEDTVNDLIGYLVLLKIQYARESV